MRTKPQISRIVFFLLAVFILSFLILYFPENVIKAVEYEDFSGISESETIPPEHDSENNEEYLRGQVLSVTDLDPQRPDIPSGDYSVVAPGDLTQEAEVIITAGDFKGETIDITNHYSQYDMYRIYLHEGMNVILVDFSGNLSGDVYLHDIARDTTIYYLMAAFAFFLVLLGGYRGLKALFALTLICLYIIKILLPLVSSGYSPVMVSVASAILLVVVTLIIIGGFNKKSFAAILGTVTGLLVAGFLALYVGRVAYLTGLSSQEAQMLFFFDETLNLRELLFAGIIIGALGAVIDVGMSVASAAREIKNANPCIGFIGLVKSSLNVGRDVMATMSNTMILAYVGAAIPLLLLIMSSDMPWLRIINIEFIATEIVRGMTISMGLIASVPATAIFAALLMTDRCESEKEVKSFFRRGYKSKKEKPENRDSMRVDAEKATTYEVKENIENTTDLSPEFKKFSPDNNETDED